MNTFSQKIRTTRLRLLPLCVTFSLFLWGHPNTSPAQDGSDGAKKPLQTLVERVRGDVTRDNALNVRDVVLIMRYLVGLETLDADQMVMADANDDDSVDLHDPIFVLRILVGKEDPLICYVCE